MHLSLRVYIQYTGLCDGINWLHNNHKQYQIVYNKQSNMADSVLFVPVLPERPLCGGFRAFPQVKRPYAREWPGAERPVTECNTQKSGQSHFGTR